MPSIKIIFSAVMALALLGAAGVDHHESNEETAEAPYITQWSVPYEESRPRDPYAEDAENIWFVGQTDDYVGHFNPQTGEFTRINLPGGTGPHNLIVAPDGVVWVAGNRDGYIGRLSTDGQDLRRIELPEDVYDPHTLVFDKEGNIWFTAQGANYIGHLDVVTEELELFEIPTEDARPYGIIVGETGDVWATLFGTNKLAHIDPESMELTEITLPHEDARPRRLAMSADGSIWYTDYNRGRLGRHVPGEEIFEEGPAVHGADSRPYGIVVDDANTLWYAVTHVDGDHSSRLIGFNPVTREVVADLNVDGYGSVRHMMFHQPTRTIWFGVDSDSLGRLTLQNEGRRAMQ